MRTVCRLVLAAILCGVALTPLRQQVPTVEAQQQQAQFPIWVTFQEPSKFANETWEKVLKAADCKANDIKLVKSYYVPNAMAVSFPVYDMFGMPVWDPAAGKWMEVKYVAYNPYFFAQMDVQSNSEKCYPILAIFSHELGHHIRGHVTVNQTWENWAKHSHQKELEADEYAGGIMTKLGASEDDIETALRLMFSTWDSPTHPNSVARIGAMCKGYYGDKDPKALQGRLVKVYDKLSTQLTRWH